MALNNEFPLVDGFTPSWSDIVIKATPQGGSLVEVKDIKSIDTNTTLEIGEQRGASGGRVIKRTTGSTTHEASLVLFYPGYVQLMRALAALAPTPRGSQKAVSLVNFDIQVQFTPPGSDEVFEFLVRGCRYAGRKISPAEGTDPQEVEVALKVIEIVDMIDGEEIVML